MNSRPTCIDCGQPMKDSDFLTHRCNACVSKQKVKELLQLALSAIMCEYRTMNRFDKKWYDCGECYECAAQDKILTYLKETKV